MNEQQALHEEAYQTALSQINDLLIDIEDKVAAHEEASEARRNWGHVGDLNAIVEQLKQITEGK